MSLRWKLLQFLNLEHLLDHQITTSADPTSSKLSKNALYQSHALRKFARSAVRSLYSTSSVNGRYAFVLSGGNVDVFIGDLTGFPALNLQSTLSDNNSPLISQSFRPHHDSVISLSFAMEGSLLITVGVDTNYRDKKSCSLKIWELEIKQAPDQENRSDQVSYSIPFPNLGIMNSTETQKNSDASHLSRSSVIVIRLKKTMNLSSAGFIQIQSGLASHLVLPTTFSITDDISLTAIGFQNGGILVFKGKLLNEKISKLYLPPDPIPNQNAQTTQSKNKNSDTNQAINFIGLTYKAIFVVSGSSISVITRNHRELLESFGSNAAQSNPSLHAHPGQDERQTVHENVKPQESFLDRQNICLYPDGSLVVARKEAIYFYNTFGKAQCLAFPSADSIIAPMGNPTVMTAIPTEDEKASQGGYLIVAGGASGTGRDNGLMIAYEIQNKLVGFRGKVSSSGIACILAATNMGDTPQKRRSSVIVSRDGSIFRLVEKSLKDRVDLLIQRSLFTPALDLINMEGGAQNQDGNPSELMCKTIQRFATYLISIGEYDKAARQLASIIPRNNLDNIGSSNFNVGLKMNPEPSWVITKLIDQPGTRSGLRIYLEELHFARVANEEHTRLLLSCYGHSRARQATNITDVEKSDSNLKVDDRHFVDDSSVENPKDFSSDLVGSSSSGSSSDGHNVEMFLAAVSDADDAEVDKVISAFRSVGLFHPAKEIAQRRNRELLLGEILVQDLDLSEECIDLLTKFAPKTVLALNRECGRKMLHAAPQKYINAIISVVSLHLSSKTKVLDFDDFLDTFVDCPQWLSVFLETALNQPSLSVAKTDNTVKLWLYLFEALLKVDVGSLGSDVQCSGCPHYYTKDCHQTEKASTGASSSSGLESSQRQIGVRALKILQSSRTQIDLKAALELAELYDHGPCLEYLYENLRLYKELGLFLLLEGNGPALLRVCRRHGDKEPSLWMDALRMFVPLASEDTKRGRAMSSNSVELNALNEVINAIDRSEILTPLELITLISSCSDNVPLAIISGYFERKLASLQGNLKEEEGIVNVLSEDLNRMRDESNSLKNSSIVMRRKRCCLCDSPLDLPAVHYYCGHSLHSSCLAVNGPITLIPSETSANDCPVCAPEYEAIRSIRTALKAKNSRHDDFFKALDNSTDSYNLVCEYLSRCPFDLI